MNDKIHIISDCDGIFTSANIPWSGDGKKSKIFSVNDSLTVNFIQEKYGDALDFTVLTGDSGEGLAVTDNRLRYMGVEYAQCKNVYKYAYIKANYDISKVIYIGDDIYDFAIFKECFAGITVCNAPAIVKKYAYYVSPYEGGKNALTDILFKICETLGIDIEQDLLEHIHSRQEVFNALRAK